MTIFIRYLSKSTLTSSQRKWIQRQDKDIFVKLRDKFGYRARSAFKLEEIDKKFGILSKLVSKGGVVVELGASPGGWTQIVCKKLNDPKKHIIIASDLLPFEPLNNVYFAQGDFCSKEIQQQIIQHIQGKLGSIQKTNEKLVNLVLSDMAPNSTGTGEMDHSKQMQLCDSAFDFAEKYLISGGNFVVKVFQGELEPNFANRFKLSYETFKRIYPEASRRQSRELYYVGLNKRN